jgi:hypothetical protein
MITWPGVRSYQLEGISLPCSTKTSLLIYAVEDHIAFGSGKAC